MIETILTEKLLEWYRVQGRILPWRDSPDPYAVWVSEIMLQQTRVETVLPYYERWMKRFPSIRDLAVATQQEVLAAWEGLGYYSRARNLHRAAQIVLNEYYGELPRNARDLRKLPGIGRYTAGAIASLAFGQDEPVLDGNVRRVLARLYDIDSPADTVAGERFLWELAATLLPKGHAASFNQAMMDLGATLCVQRAPACPRCPLANECRALAHGTQQQRPVLRPSAAIPHLTVTAAVIHRSGKYLISQRPAHGLLGGLWEFPGGKQEPGEDLSTCLVREIREELGADVNVGELLGVYRHAYTHFRVTLHAFCCHLKNAAEPHPLEVRDLRWVTPAELENFPMGKIDRRIANRLKETQC